MEVQYYDTCRARKIGRLIKVDPYLARQKYEEYLMEYPCDYNSWCLYIGVLISLHEFELAEEKLNYIEGVASNNTKYLSDPKKRYTKLKDFFFCRLRLLNYTNRYKDLFEMIRLDENRCYMYEFKFFKLLDIYCRKKLGKHIDLDRVDDNYLMRQIIDYSFELMVSHVNEHSSEYNLMLDVPNPGVFSHDFPIQKVLSEFKDRADYDKRMCSGLIDDSYFFKYDNCGRVDGKSTDYFKVVCFSDSYDIITMFPEEYGEYYPYIDLNFLKENTSSKVKCISQRDRFNRKYNRK